MTCYSIIEWAHYSGSRHVNGYCQSEMFSNDAAGAAGGASLQTRVCVVRVVVVVAFVACRRRRCRRRRLMTKINMRDTRS